MKSQVVTLDVREDIRCGREPFSKIMGKVGRLRPEEQLLIVAPFAPVPLFGVLAKLGFKHNARQIEKGDWEVLFTRDGAQARARAALPIQPALSENRPVEFMEVDARGLEPPQPMVKILEALATLPAGAGLRAHTDRRPMHLYAQLEERGFTGETLEQNDGSFLTTIRSC